MLHLLKTADVASPLETAQKRCALGSRKRALIIRFTCSNMRYHHSPNSKNLFFDTHGCVHKRLVTISQANWLLLNDY